MYSQYYIAHNANLCGFHGIYLPINGFHGIYLPINGFHGIYLPINGFHGIYLPINANTSTNQHSKVAIFHITTTVRDSLVATIWVTS